MGSNKLNNLFERISKPVWNIIAGVFILIGVAGIFIPLLPTTPFLLIAAYCLNRGSDRMKRWFENNKTINMYLRNYREKKGMPFRAKMNSIVILWITIGISFYLIDNIYVRVILGIVVISVTAHILMIPNYKEP